MSLHDQFIRAARILNATWCNAPAMPLFVTAVRLAKSPSYVLGLDYTMLDTKLHRSFDSEFIDILRGIVKDTGADVRDGLFSTVAGNDWNALYML